MVFVAFSDGGCWLLWCFFSIKGLGDGPAFNDGNLYNGYGDPYNYYYYYYCYYYYDYHYDYDYDYDYYYYY